MDTPTNEPNGLPLSPETPADVTADTGGDSEAKRLEAIQRASDSALGEHNATVKRKPGQRGPDKVKRAKKLSVDFLGNGSRQALPQSFEPDDNPDGWKDPAPADFNEAGSKAFFCMVCDAIELGAKLACSFVGIKKGKHNDVIKAAQANCKPEPVDKEEFAISWTAVAKKHGWKVDNMPEYAATVASGKVTGPMFSQIRTLLADDVTPKSS